MSKLDDQKRNHASSENESIQVSDPEPAGGNPDATINLDHLEGVGQP